MAFVTRLVAALAGTRVAAAAGKYGVIGTAAGLVVTSAVLRWPGKALVLGGGYGLFKLWKKQQQDVPLLEDKSGSKSYDHQTSVKRPLSQTSSDQL